MVVLIHVNAHYLDVTNHEVSMTMVVQNWINVITRFSVPCFIMLSGAFTLSGKRVINSVEFYKNSFYKIVIPFLEAYIFWAIIVTIKHILKNDSFTDIFISLASSTFGYLWFMPMIIGLKIIAPIIALTERHMSIKMFRKVAIGILIWGAISQGTSEYMLPYSIGVVMSFSGYFLIGKCLYDLSSRTPTRISIRWIVFGIVLLSVVATIIRLFLSQFYAIDPYKTFFSPVVIVISVLCFLLFGKIKMNHISDRGRRKVIKMSEATFYVYLVHAIVISVLFKVAGWILGENDLLKTLVVAILGIIGSFVLAFIWIKIRNWVDQIFHIKERICDVKIQKE